MSGFVLDEEGAPVANVKLRVAGQGKTLTLYTNDAGRYTLGADEGDYAISVDLDSVRPAYSSMSSPLREVRLSPGTPSRVDFVLRANRHFELR